MENENILEKLEETLKESQKSIKCYKYISIVIIIAGLFLILVPAILYFTCQIKGLIDEKTTKMGFEIFVFVGIGLAIIITTLIINSKASIIKTTRQLIQIQISSFSYFKQLEIIEDKDAIEKSKRLEEVINSLQETLCKFKQMEIIEGMDAIEKSKRLEEVINSLQETLCKFKQIEIIYGMDATEKIRKLEKVINSIQETLCKFKQLKIIDCNDATEKIKKLEEVINLLQKALCKFKQLEIIDCMVDATEKSKRLEEVTNSTQETLCKYFDSLPQNE